MKMRYCIIPVLLSCAIFLLVSSCKKSEEDSPSNSTVTDIDGNVYKTVTIGTQVWMQENLKVTRFNDGTPIPLVTDDQEWSALSTPAYCWLKNDKQTFGTVYGALYNWHAVNSGKLCPPGWHVASDAEWTTLTDFLGGNDVAGGKLKETGTAHWKSPNTGATNESGFTALPGGNRYFDGTWDGYYCFGEWWTSTENPSYGAKRRTVSYEDDNMYTANFGKTAGFAVRCIKD